MSELLFKRAAIPLGKERVKFSFQMDHADLIGDLGKIGVVNSDKSWFKISDEASQGIADIGDELKEEAVDIGDGLGIHEGKVGNVLGCQIDGEKELMLFPFDRDSLAISTDKASPLRRKLIGHFFGILAILPELVEEKEHSAMID